MLQTSPTDHIFETNPDMVDSVFRAYQESPNAVSPEWRQWFDAFRSGFASASAFFPSPVSSEAALEGAVQRLTDAYKRYGHLKAKTNPLGLNRDNIPILSLTAHALSESQLNQSLQPNIWLKLPKQTLQQRIESLETIFCGTSAPEFEHVEDPSEKNWLYEKAGSFHNSVSNRELTAVFEELAFADAFEKTLATKYIGKKRFSIEGADAQIPALETLLDKAAEHGVKECLMGMAHRGRLATIVGVVKMPFEMMLAEFEGEIPDDACCDDVKYHCGFESQRKTRSGRDIRILMTSNPSHLEAVDPVLMGEARARQDSQYGGNTSLVLPILMHGDAAISGQGVVYETLQMANLDGYTVGGIIHVITNNQLGFTTDPEYSRSSTSCTDIARVIGAPIVHVNAEDLVAVHNVMSAALEYRQKFKKDFFVDLVCYRRHGHNEADEPTYTQPALYKRIKEKQSPWALWRDTLLSQHTGFSADELNAKYAQVRSNLDAVYLRMKKDGLSLSHNVWTTSCGHPAKAESILAPVNTAVSLSAWKRSATGLLTFPPNAKPHAKLSRMLLAQRAEIAAERANVDWGMGEMMAYATLIDEGFSFRMSGQDVGRGTFSHRHAVFVDEESGEKLIPLKNMIRTVEYPAQKVEVINSPLSEFSVLGFEYGYARTHDKSLVVWEAQFGDFANGAQVIIDQFIASGECKWHRVNNMVLMLPHGFEGQGAEHSSARIERFLQLAADGNMIVANVTSSAQLFHILRRQMHGHAHKPLVIFTPKSYLRSSLTACPTAQFTDGHFCEVQDDNAPDAAKVRRVVLCSGKIALDLIAHRAENSAAGSFSETAIVRIEQLYPLQTQSLTKIFKRYPNAEKYFWVQEEPKNMGPWLCIAPEIRDTLSVLGKHVKLHYVGRHAKSSPAGGLEKIHKSDQAKLVDAAFSATGWIEV